MNWRSSFHRSSRSGRPWQQASHAVAVTMFLMLFSVLVAAFSRFGDDTLKVDVLYFASQKPLTEVMYTQEEWENWENIPQEEIIQRNLTIAAILKEPQRDLLKGEVWRAFTPMFLHFGILHLVFNMMWLWQFGVLLETRFRSWPFLAMVLAIALLSNVAQSLVSGTNFGGMSGVNYGLFGFILARSKLHPEPGFVIHRQTAALLLIWLVVCFTGMVGNVADTAHLVGFLSGGLMGVVNALIGGGWKVLQRRQQFRSSLRKSADALHHCKTCGKTELDDPHLEFYVHPGDGEEYCIDHLPK
jgi:membrane associated rhomboid family serine protease